jgi:precorrin-6B methylase 2
VNAVDRWRADLEAWAIPPAILEAAPESPYGFPAELFRSRGQRATEAEVAEPTPTTVRASEALPEGGVVLDVGCGGGATSLPLAGRASAVVGVDAQEGMLEGFLRNARAAGLDAEAIQGRWPDVAERVPDIDVAVAGHVLYNVADIEPFVRALSTKARRRVVCELTGRHPLHWMNDLWRTFHDEERPERPTAETAVEALAELGFEPAIEIWDPPLRFGGFERREDAVALVRRRLCLPAERDHDLARALGDRLARRGDLWSAGPKEQRLATIWFDAR